MTKLKREMGLTVREVGLSSEKGEEKGVDMSVCVRMLEMGNIGFHIVLIASDKDYVPALELLRKMGVHTIVVGFKDKCPIDLINHSYHFIDMQELLETMEKSMKVGPEKKAR